MARTTINSDLLVNPTSVKTERDDALFYSPKYILKFINKNLNPIALKDFETRVELLGKSSFFITILPKQIFWGQNYMQPIDTFQLLDLQRFQRVKKTGRDQTRMQLFLLQEYLKQLKKRRNEVLELIEAKNRESNVIEQDNMFRYVLELRELLDNLRTMLVPGPLHIKYQLIPCAAVFRFSPLQLFLNTKGPVMFNRVESTAFYNWAFLSWCVSGQQSLNDSFELCFLQLNVPSNEMAHNGVHTVTDNTFQVNDLLPEKTYEFSIRRTKACNVVYDEWCDVITLITGKASECQFQSVTLRDCQRRHHSKQKPK
ncbi:fibronectin type III domain-containing protein 11 [Mantella aurantiaca]